jgi:homocysteine S-methyltransferase
MVTWDELFEGRHCMVLDGGLGSYLESSGGLELNSIPDLWAAGLLLSHPELLAAAHAEFLTAGSDIITSSSYQLTLPGLLRTGVVTDPRKALELFELSTSLVRQCIDTYCLQQLQHTGRHRPLIAASIGSYGAHLADGSEYTGQYGDKCSVAELTQFHDEKLSILLSTRPDIIAFETVPCIQEVKAIVNLLSKDQHTPGAPCQWLSIACSSPTTLNSGESIEDAIRYIEEGASLSTQSTAIGVNCTDPRHVESILHCMRDNSRKGRRLVAYPNLGEEWDVAADTTACCATHPSDADTTAGADKESKKSVPVPNTGISEEQFLELSTRWYDEGSLATIIGGCCRVTPPLIRKLKQRVSTFHSAC